jgi:hypothetical protein
MIYELYAFMTPPHHFLVDLQVQEAYVGSFRLGICLRLT